MRSLFARRPGFDGTLPAALRALADPHRLSILALLNERGEMTITDLTDALVILKQPTVSHHVKVLGGVGLVSRNKRGQFRYVRLEPRAVAEVASALNPWQAS